MVLARLYPEWQRVSAMHPVGRSARRHQEEEPGPYGHVREVAAAERTVKCETMHDRTLADRLHETIDGWNQQVQKRHAQQLVVEGRHPHRPQQRIQPEHTYAIAHPEDGASQGCARRSRWV